MIVMLMLVVVFVVSDAVAEAHFARESRFGQEFQRAIDGESVRCSGSSCRTSR